MKPHYFDISSLEEELKQLPPLHRVAFAASICERMLPNYNAFCRMESWGDPSVPRKALDEIWDMLAGETTDVAKLCQLRENCSIEDVLPDSDEFYHCYYILEAQEAIFAICSTLLAYIDSNVRSIVSVVINARFNTIELFIGARDESFNARQYKNKNDELEAIANHPFAVREMAKEKEDLRRLKEIKKLERDFLEWLRTSFENDGKSIIDVS